MRRPIKVVLTYPAVSLPRGQPGPKPIRPLQPHNVNVERVNYKGTASIRVTVAMEPKAEGDEDRVAPLTDTSFQKARLFVNGAIAHFADQKVSR